jgi:hypothetical protein
MRSVLAIVILLALTGCSDGVTTRFPHLSDAKSQGALERGRLPPLLPDSARWACFEKTDREKGVFC